MSELLQEEPQARSVPQGASLVTLLGLVEGEVLTYVEAQGSTTLGRLNRQLPWPTRMVTMAVGSLVREGLLQATQQELEVALRLQRYSRADGPRALATSTAPRMPRVGHWVGCGAGLTAAIGLAALVRTVWLSGPANGVLAPVLPRGLVEGTVVAMDFGSEQPSLSVVDALRQEAKLEGLAFNATPVFQRGGVLSPAHLKVGQYVRVFAEHRNGKPFIRTIEIVRQPPPWSAQLRLNGSP